MTWADRARALIEHVTADLPENATLEDRRKALRAARDGYVGGTSWGAKIWGREARRYLERHGQSRKGLPVARDTRWDDIVFPWRGESEC